MKNLKNFNVQELSIQEQKETDGGWFLTLLVVALVVGVVAGLWDSTDSCPET
ncbi:hypothetical protein [uncultured Polaribacter sp.]|uniref:hypothetical protein n=1 Tax=uncultured Polaribacter sp. TaxID=174711 RepID=UPI0030D8242B|tara:strand:- start:4145 stop:4300 length:156 start_codon:yes stop_codon:yes gene_type:complete